MPENHKPKVVFIEVILPHYRIPFYQKLCQSNKMELTSAHGFEKKDASLKCVRNPQGVREILISNHFFGGPLHLVRQSGIFKILKSGKFDTVIHDFELRTVSCLFVLFAARLLHHKFIWWGHGIGPKRKWYSRLIRRKMASWADAIIFYDDERANLFINWGVPKEKVFVARNSIDTESIFPLASDQPFRNRRRILYTGRLIAEKKVDLLIHAYSHIMPSDTILTLIGDGPEMRNLKTLAASLKIEGHVEFAGSITDQKQLAPYFNDSLLSVSPGAVGLSAVHAMAYGIPMLVADNEPHGPEFTAILDGKTGFLFHSGDLEDLKNKLVSLTNDPETLQKIGKNAKDFIKERYSLSKMVESFEKAVSYAQSIK